MKKKLLFLTLNTFSATGGIEKVCRVAGKALHEIAEAKGEELLVHALHDAGQTTDDRYFPPACFRGFGGSLPSFILSSLRAGRGAETVLLSHINLLPVGYLIKLVSPRTKLVLMAHGIEVWGTLGRIKTKMLRAVDVFLPVSKFTGNKLQTRHQVPEAKLQVLNNCLDPFLQYDRELALEETLRKKYGIAASDTVLLTVTRLKHSEQYKGYDRVVKALGELQQQLPSIKYLIVGKYDAEEKTRLDALITKAGVENRVIFAGFAEDNELRSHFALADAYVMPSTGEGFGIVFIEALFYGLPVIAGNADGSADALANGKFGKLINPTDHAELVNALLTVCRQKEAFVPNAEQVLEQFGFGAYRRRLEALLFSNTGDEKRRTLSRTALKSVSVSQP